MGDAVRVLPLAAVPKWDWFATYQRGDEVRYHDGRRYRALMVNVGCRPSVSRRGTLLRPWAKVDDGRLGC